MNFSIVIPVYDRPDELLELLDSISVQKGEVQMEVIVVDDGSFLKSERIVKQFDEILKIKYYFKKNTGPGDSRNYGMNRAEGDYFLLFDSDCILPENYMSQLQESLLEDHAEAFTGPDRSHPSFTHIQKAINYAMTSFLTTGGLRGANRVTENFQLRSFNMGLSKKAFEISGGFARQNIGEDIELNFRIRELGLKCRYLPEAYVFHKRRTSWKQFFRQTRNFGAARPVLNQMYPGTAKLSYWFPAVFLIGLIFAVGAAILGNSYLLGIYLFYGVLIFLGSIISNKSFLTGLMSPLAALVQFTGYGSGFLRSYWRLYFLRRPRDQAFPKMFQ